MALLEDEYYKEERVKEEAQNRRAARICATIANVNRDPKKKREPFSEDFFMPQRVQQSKKKEQSPEEQKVIIGAVLRGMEGKT